VSIGLPAHLRRESVSRAFARTMNTVACTSFVIALASVLAWYVSDSTRVMWPAAVAAILMLITVWLMNQYRSPFVTVAHLVVGGPALYWFAFTVISQVQPLSAAGQFVVNLLAIGLVLVGGPGGTLLWSIVWCTGGLLVSWAAVSLASGQLMGQSLHSRSVFTAYIVVILVLITVRASQRGVRRVQSSLHRAARDNELAQLRYGIEATAAAVLHDTVLGHLASIAHAPPGAINPQLKREIVRDLEVLVGEDWLSGSAHDRADGAATGWHKSTLGVAIAEARAMELEVDVTGDTEALARLDPRGATALGPAVKQCLVNVIKHSGTMRAEVAVFASDREVSVLVVDAGRGFDDAKTGADRLGLRQSVRRRIELVDGSVQVWSTPGLGTSVMIRIPTSSENTLVAGSAVE